MIVYKDRAFCDQPHCSKFTKCDRALKIHHLEEAKKANLPIDIYNFRECYKPRNKDK